ncbi:DUF1697 domain-containing protein [Flammeovirga sp. EKP202]|uniref:DUF1697 domain-containing protein n=1 Tax=Flammeovirga sp. EKP202 TaxID=2770592 RepID=UPI00165FF58C|nr:DUF1697 domain-containing protein [Flammeovirga sp. EKP202]MBD0402773.1 DUF1697 domain-containing protein [Flammeovirga sp. EKP202]
MGKHKYISLLRGINVGGRRKILMKDLKELYQKEEVEELQTYIQSGNVLFQSKAIVEADFSQVIKERIQEQYGFDVPVITVDLQTLKNVVKLNPYFGENVSIDSLHLTVLSIIPEKDKLEQIVSPVNGDEFFIHDRFVFIHCQGKYSQSKLSNQYFEKKLGVEATTRNWKTVEKLIALHEN